MEVRLKGVARLVVVGDRKELAENISCPRHQSWSMVGVAVHRSSNTHIIEVSGERYATVSYLSTWLLAREFVVAPLMLLRCYLKISVRSIEGVKLGPSTVHDTQLIRTSQHFEVG